MPTVPYITNGTLTVEFAVIDDFLPKWKSDRTQLISIAVNKGQQIPQAVFKSEIYTFRFTLQNKAGGDSAYKQLWTLYKIWRTPGDKADQVKIVIPNADGDTSYDVKPNLLKDQGSDVFSTSSPTGVTEIQGKIMLVAPVFKTGMMVEAIEGTMDIGFDNISAQL